MISTRHHPVTDEERHIEYRYQYMMHRNGLMDQTCRMNDQDEWKKSSHQFFDDHFVQCPIMRMYMNEYCSRRNVLHFRMPRVPVLTSPSSKDHAQFKGEHLLKRILDLIESFFRCSTRTITRLLYRKSTHSSSAFHVHSIISIGKRSLVSIRQSMNTLTTNLPILVDLLLDLTNTILQIHEFLV